MFKTFIENVLIKSEIKEGFSNGKLSRIHGWGDSMVKLPFSPNNCVIVVLIKIPRGFFFFLTKLLLKFKMCKNTQHKFVKKAKKEDRLHHLPSTKTKYKPVEIRTDVFR